MLIIMDVLYRCVSVSVPCRSGWLCCTGVFQSVFHADQDGCVVPVCFSQCSMQIRMAVLYRCASASVPCRSGWLCCTSVFQLKSLMQIMMAVLYRCVSVEKPDADHDGCVVPVSFS